QISSVTLRNKSLSLHFDRPILAQSMLDWGSCVAFSLSLWGWSPPLAACPSIPTCPQVTRATGVLATETISPATETSLVAMATAIWTSAPPLNTKDLAALGELGERLRNDERHAASGRQQEQDEATCEGRFSRRSLICDCDRSRA